MIEHDGCYIVPLSEYQTRYLDTLMANQERSIELMRLYDWRILTYPELRMLIEREEI